MDLSVEPWSGWELQRLARGSSGPMWLRTSALEKLKSSTRVSAIAVHSWCCPEGHAPKSLPEQRLDSSTGTGALPDSRRRGSAAVKARSGPPPGSLDGIPGT